MSIGTVLVLIGLILAVIALFVVDRRLTVGAIILVAAGVLIGAAPLVDVGS